MIMSSWDKVESILRNVKEIIEEKGLDYYTYAPREDTVNVGELSVFEFDRLLAVAITKYIGEYWNE